MPLTDLTFIRALAATDGGPRPSPHLVFELAADTACVAEARHRVGAHLDRIGYGADTRDTALLLVSELFTNAVLHTSSSRIGCAVRPLGAHLRIEVRDQSAGTVLRPGRAGLEEVHGRGLFMVDALSADWGVSAEGVGQTVWCHLRPEAC